MVNGRGVQFSQTIWPVVVWIYTESTLDHSLLANPKPVEKKETALAYTTMKKKGMKESINMLPRISKNAVAGLHPFLLDL